MSDDIPVDQAIATMALRAGLERALRDFPGDVALAAEDALQAVALLVAPTDPAIESWPPMRVQDRR
jgi:hypothetical protein